MSVVFSLIIPHFNDADDLKRCIASIPEREDLEVIIVDDNSDSEEVDFAHFPGKERSDTSIVFSKGENGKGPGFARNEGIRQAQGKWILFSDSDDYFLPSLNSELDKYKDSDADVIYFKLAKRNLEGEISSYEMFNQAIDEARREGKPDAISFGVPSPVAKLIKRDFLLENNIGFQQITGGDDILFSIKIALNLKHYELSDMEIYCVVDRPGSLTRNNQWRGFRSYTLACCEAYKLMNPIGKGRMAYDWTASWWGRLRAENKLGAISLLPKVASAMGVKKSLHCYKKAMKVKRWNWTEREK